MATINPITGLEEDENKSPVSTDLEGNLTTGVSPLNVPDPIQADTLIAADTVDLTEDIQGIQGTPSFEIQGADAVVDIEEESAGEIPALTFDEDTVVDIISKKRADRTEAEQEMIRKFQAKRALNATKGLDAFGNPIGGEVTPGEVDTTAAEAEAEAAKQKIRDASAEALTDKEVDVELRLEKAKTDIAARGEQRMKVLDRGLSFSGFGRSSVAVQKRDEIQSSINAEVRQAQAKADLEVQLFKAQQAGADSKAISAISKSLASATATLRETEAENAIALAKASQELGLKADEALNALLEGTAQGLEAKDKGFDEKASMALGYVSDSFGNPLVSDAEGNPIAFEGDELSASVKVTNFKDGNDNTYVYKNGRLDAIIQNDGKILKGDELDTITVPGTVVEDKKDQQRRDIETQLRKEFNGRDEVKKFNKIRSEFARIQKASQTKNFETGIADVALVFAYMKMLDPTSVVREGEFATAQNSAGVPESIRNAFNKASSGQFLSVNQRKDIVGLSKELFQSEKDVVNSIIDQTRLIAEDAGARGEFIIGDFEAGIDSESQFELDEEESSELDTLFPTETEADTTPTETQSSFKTKSGKSFNIDLSGFNVPEQTGQTKGIESFIKSKEGLRLEAYLDSGGVPTIGYGATKVNGVPVKIGDTITKESAEAIFQEDIDRHSNYKKILKVELTSKQKAALASFEFNLGPNIWKTTGKSIIDDINSGNIESAIKTLLAHNKVRKDGKLEVVKGLTNRRNEEAELLRSNGA